MFCVIRAAIGQRDIVSAHASFSVEASPSHLPETRDVCRLRENRLGRLDHLSEGLQRLPVPRRVSVSSRPEPASVQPRHRPEHRPRTSNWKRRWQRSGRPACRRLDARRHSVLRSQQTVLHQSVVLRRRRECHLETV